MIAIIDYKAGNQTSVLRALEFLNIEARITDDDDTIMKAHGVIFRESELPNKLWTGLCRISRTNF